MQPNHEYPLLRYHSLQGVCGCHPIMSTPSSAIIVHRRSARIRGDETTPMLDCYAVVMRVIVGITYGVGCCWIVAVLCREQILESLTVYSEGRGLLHV